MADDAKEAAAKAASDKVLGKME